MSKEDLFPLSPDDHETIKRIENDSVAYLAFLEQDTTDLKWHWMRKNTEEAVKIANEFDKENPNFELAAIVIAMTYEHTLGYIQQCPELLETFAYLVHPKGHLHNYREQAKLFQVAKEEFKLPLKDLRVKYKLSH